MATETKIPDFALRWVKRLEESPYGADLTLPAALNFEVSDQIDSLDRVAREARRILEQMQRVLAYWSPERIEQEAYRRAGDNSGPTLIAREASIFTLYVNEVLLKLAELSITTYSGTSNEKFKIEQRAEGCRLLLPTLEILDRRASTAEHRAMDLRLRYEFDKLRAEVAGQQLASAVGAAIIRAAQAPEDEMHIAEVLEGLKRIEGKVDRLGPEVEFAADAVMEQYIAPKLVSAPERAVKALLRASRSVAVRGVLQLLVLRLGLGG